MRRDKKQIKPLRTLWTEEQYELFRNSLTESKHRSFFDLLRAGLRQMEAAALTPADITKEGVRINKCYDIALGDLPVKSKSTNRTVVISDDLRLQLMSMNVPDDKRIFDGFDARRFFHSKARQLDLPIVSLASLRER